MEILVGAAVIVVLLLCLGVDWGIIAMGIMALIGLGMVLLAIFFLVCAAALPGAERVSAVFTELRRGNGRFDVAYYVIDGREYPNLFPGEFVMRDRFYRRDKPVRVRLLRKAGVVFDRNAIGTILVGLAVSLPVSVFFVICVLVFAGVI
ncbi:MAG: hypothetical protein K2O14_01095 [Oscillospiraceae bacterium]|nr:hypothetical protein [Oscillospiraceae bacterium]